MSTRVCLIITCAWFVLGSDANGQPERNRGGGQSRRTLSTGAEPGVATQEWLSEPAPVVEHVSNAARSVSSLENIANESPSPEPDRDSTLTSRNATTAMPLPPRSKRSRDQTTKRPGSSGRALMTVLGSLAIVLAVFFVFVWVTRSAAPKGMAPLSKEVVESLGRAPLLGRQQMQLIRIGNKLILLSVTSTGADTLTEITDPEEVDRLAGLCRQAQAGSISETFRQVLAHASSEPATSPRERQRQARRSGTLEPHRA